MESYQCTFYLYIYQSWFLRYACRNWTWQQQKQQQEIEDIYVFLQDIEPGLEESESFYTLTYTVLFLGHAIGSIVAGFLFNYIPTWYLFLCSTLSLIFGYLLYALASNGWMMILARGLAGIQLGTSTALSFAYFCVSFEKYTENIKLLDKYESKKVARVKKYLFSTYSIGTFFGRVVGIGECTTINSRQGI